MVQGLSSVDSRLQKNRDENKRKEWPRNILGNREWFWIKSVIYRVKIGSIPEQAAFGNKHCEAPVRGLRGSLRG